METFWWIFVVCGIICIVIELFTPGLIVLWFGISFVAAAIPVYFGAPAWLTAAVFVISLLVLMIFVRDKAIKLLTRKNGKEKTNFSALISRKGHVLEDIDPVKGTGSVRVDREIWTAVSNEGDCIPVDARIEVVGIEGVKLVVKRSD